MGGWNKFARSCGSNYSPLFLLRQVLLAGFKLMTHDLGLNRINYDYFKGKTIHPDPIGNETTKKNCIKRKRAHLWLGEAWAHRAARCWIQPTLRPGRITQTWFWSILVGALVRTFTRWKLDRYIINVAMEKVQRPQSSWYQLLSQRSVMRSIAFLHNYFGSIIYPS